MIYLAARIFLYLLFALALGAAAGWAWRNLRAAAREGALQQRLAEVEARARELESRCAEQTQQLAQRDWAVADLEQTCETLRERLKLAATAAHEELPPPAPAADPEEARLLRRKLQQAERALREERQRVVALARERELQATALNALEQQLEMARDGLAEAD